MDHARLFRQSPHASRPVAPVLRSDSHLVSLRQNDSGVGTRTAREQHERRREPDHAYFWHTLRHIMPYKGLNVVPQFP